MRAARRAHARARAEAEQALRKYLATRRDGSPRLFRISPHNFIAIWRQASQESGARVTPQVLRGWFCDELGRLAVPDRFVDALCGRAPKSVLARRYSDFTPQKLRAVYEGARLSLPSIPRVLQAVQWAR